MGMVGDIKALSSCCYALRLFHTVITTFILTFSLTSSTHLFHFSPAAVQGRLLLEVRHVSSSSSSSLPPPLPLPLQKVGGEEEKVMMRGQMGSRPPRCEGKCTSCGHCQAVQVPTNTVGGSSILSPMGMGTGMGRSSVTYARGDNGYSDYKPMSWKCKCGSSLFNP